MLLPHLDGWADARRAAARGYEEAGLGELVMLPVPAPGTQPAWHLYVTRHDRVDELAAGLGEAGVGNKVYYRTPVHEQPAMAPYRTAAPLPVTDELARTHLAIPISPALDRVAVEEVVSAVRSCVASLSPS